MELLRAILRSRHDIMLSRKIEEGKNRKFLIKYRPAIRHDIIHDMTSKYFDILTMIVSDVIGP